MAKRRLQLTGFARLFLFLVIMIPSIFFGVSYAKGEDGMQTIKNVFGMETTSSSNDSGDDKPSFSNSNDETYSNGEIKRLNDELTEKENRLKELYQENKSLKKAADDAKAELEVVKQKLEKIESAFN